MRFRYTLRWVKYKYSPKATKLSKLQSRKWAVGFWCFFIFLFLSIILSAILSILTNTLLFNIGYTVGFVLGLLLAICVVYYISSIDCDKYSVQDVLKQIQTNKMTEDVKIMVDIFKHINPNATHEQLIQFVIERVTPTKQDRSVF